MKKRNEFVEYIVEDLLAEVDGVSARAMFGGFGLYKEGVIVGIVIDDELYLKVDESNRAEYEAEGSTPFSYERKVGKVVAMSYWKVSSDIIENPEKLTRLFEMSYEINLKPKEAKRRRAVKS